MFTFSVILFTVMSVLPSATPHGCLSYPNPRGSLGNRSSFIWNMVDDKAPVDWLPHFPAGDRNPIPGSALAYQRKATGDTGWSLYQPFNKSMAWRADVCGDMLPPNKQDHRFGGRFYYGGKIVKTYHSGDVISAGISIIAHHNGFIQFHLCDVSKCPGPDISISCFQTPGACIELRRARNKYCDGGYSKSCGPIDRNYPGRWYLPCTHHPGNDRIMDRYGYGVSNTILYQIPRGFSCEHCVMQWFWSAAVTCNPPGVFEYYRGPDAPKTWGNCFGQGGARGGYTTTQQNCSMLHSPEEYMSCVDIRVLPRRFDPEFKYVSVNKMKAAYHNGKGGVRAIVLLVNGAPYRFLKARTVVDLTRFKNEWVTVQAIAESSVSMVTFFLEGRKVSDSTGPTFYATGNYIKPWAKLEFNKWINLIVLAKGDQDSVSLYLKK